MRHREKRSRRRAFLAFSTAVLVGAAMPLFDTGTAVANDAGASAVTSHHAAETSTPLAQQATPLALDARSCSYADAGTGAYAQTLCWIDFTGFTTEYRDRGWLSSPRYVSVLDPQDGPFTHTVTGSQHNLGSVFNRSYWGDVRDVDVNVQLGGGYTLRAKLDTSSSGDFGSAGGARALTSAAFPTWSSSFLGNSIGGQPFYTGVSGQPALYQAYDNNGTVTMTLKNVRLYHGNQEVRDFSMVVADAETTDSSEGISWSTTGIGFRWLPNTPPGSTREQVMGSNTCAQHSPAWNSVNPSQTASCNGSSSSSIKNGTPMLATAPPTNASTQFDIAQTLTGNGRQGVAFGVITARAAAETTVTDRIVGAQNDASDATSFVTTARAGGNVLMTAETGSTALTSGEISRTVPVSATGTEVQYSSAAVGSQGSSYTPAWRCEKHLPSTGETRYWPSATTTSPTPPASADAFSVLKVGEFLKCSVTYSPPYLSLVKEVDHADTGAENSAGDFTLTAAGQTLPNSTITGPGGGDAAAAVTKRPVAVGDYLLSEQAPATGSSTGWPFGYDWTGLECLAEPGSTQPGSLSLTPDEHPGTIASGTLSVLPGNAITCTFTNTAREPQLQTSKDAFDADGQQLGWGQAVDAGTAVYYRLTFDNAGTAAKEFDYVDHLADVLDDARFVDGSIRISDGSETAYPQSSLTNPGVQVEERLDLDDPQLAISGTVQRGAVRTVWFAVTTMTNAENATERQAGFDRDGDASSPNRGGYALNNFLLPAGTDVPAACEEPTGDAPGTCTHHPIPAWSLNKDSRPADGARLHKGGNTHYQITATKMNEATQIRGLVFTDDLTHVFKTAGWAPGAAVPGGALTRGIYFFDDSGQSLDASGNPIGTPDQPAAAFDQHSGYVPEPEYDPQTERWMLTTEPVDVPEAAVRAELWFAVQAGESPADVPAEWSAAGTPAAGWRYVNYATANADSLEPNQCITGTDIPNTSLSPVGGQPNDKEFPAACQVTHQLAENYFTIRKDASGTGLPGLPEGGGWGDSTGLTNMVGHEFEIRDDVDGQPSEYPSMKLCRAEYNPEFWDGEFITGGTPAWNETSEIPGLITAHNNALAEGEEPLPMCGLLYPQGTFGGQAHAGGQDGRWRSEYLTAGLYWLVETKAPDQQINNAGTAIRNVPGVQLLSEPIQFTVWPDEPGEYFGDQDPQQSMHGQGQLDVTGEDARCSPGAPVGERPVACVNPTGYLMLVKDAAPLQLPLAGGPATLAFTVVGAVIAAVAILGIIWWRRRQDLGIETR